MSGGGLRRGSRGRGARSGAGWSGHEGADLLIAATALARGWTVVTGNRRHFEPTGVALLDPSLG